MRMDEMELLRRELFHAIKGLDVIQELLEDPEITEIMINGPDHIFIEKGGKLFESTRKFESTERLLDIIRMVAAGANRSINLASPIVDARLPDGSRVNAVLDPVALNGPVMTIRRFGDSPITAGKLIELGSLTEECLIFLEKLVRSGYNILISGGTGAGKTTVLNVLSSFIPEDERIITIEDSAELHLHGIPNLVRFEARMETADGVKAITIRDLIKTALRCRPDRVIVGEVRSEEAIDMLQALNIGQDGSMSTIHANSAEDALYRLETIVMLSSEIPLKALRRQIASGIDIIIHLGRLRDKSRRLLEVLEVSGMQENEIVTHPLFTFEETGEE
ncbi:MAG: CpaF family protein, partial [Parasporobacterium sp.]|nr:CpaF family protein [Parasporobacterium sp.]